MTDTEAKALALELDRIANQLYAADPTPIIVKAVLYIHSTIGAEARHAAELREQAERFSEAASLTLRMLTPYLFAKDEVEDILAPFILPKPDPLVEAIRDMALTDATQEDADRLRAALAARGGKIVWGDDQ